METERTYTNYFDLRGVNSETYSSYQLPHYIKQELPENRNLSILDIGCGFGQMLHTLKQLGYTNLHGIELQPEAAEYCSQVLGLDVHCESDIIQYSSSHKSEYGVILMSHVLEHLPKDQVIDSLKAIHSMLIPGGKFLLMVPNGQAPIHSYWMWEDFTHNMLFTAGSVLYVLKAAGFHEIKFLDPYFLEGVSFPKKLVKRFFQKIFYVNKKFWNSVNSSGYHDPSPVIYTWELRVLAHGSAIVKTNETSFSN